MKRGSKASKQLPSSSIMKRKDDEEEALLMTEDTLSSSVGNGGNNNHNNHNSNGHDDVYGDLGDLRGVDDVDDDGSSSAGGSGGGHSIGSSSGETTGTSRTHQTSKSEAELALSFMETKAVNRTKILVYVAILLAAAAVSAITFIILSKEEENNMSAEFQAYSREILKQATGNSENMFEELFDMGKGITSHALFTNSTWPNVTLPNFDIRAHDERSRIEFVGFAPFVKPEDKLGWESYSVDNQDWIAQDYAYKGWADHQPDPIPTEIHNCNANVEDPWFSGQRRTKVYNYSDPTIFEYQVPLWQVAPSPKDTSIINMDLASHPVLAHLLWDVRVKKVDQYSRAIDVSFLLGSNVTSDGHPRGTIFQPVFDDFHEDAEVVGFMMGVLIWDNMFENVLFESVAPLLVEIVGNCSAGFTYMLTGDEVVFLGPGTDWNEPRFEKYKKSADLLAPKNSREGYPLVLHKHRSTDAAHNESHCTYVMNTYPTEEFEEYYMTNGPIYFTIAIAAVFICTGLVFLVYDLLVQRRQNKLLKTARQTDAIVSSLFPKSVQQQLMKEQEAKAAEEKAVAKSKRSSSAATAAVWSANRKGREMSNFLAPGGGGGGSMTKSGGLLDSTTKSDDMTIGRSSVAGGKGMPIADLFPEATVFFGDIAGFTAWSSMREPTQVFILLETIYNSFDALANKRRVFKVETVGDCYVAVCGLPEARRDHAVVMCRFARDCLESMNENLHALEKELGPDTTELGVRIGLNSGPVTAGVLRGERARFQLFGDTVNTASRIETTGQKNRIHLSEETANLLIKVGKDKWLTERMDKVQAKGKGELKTYWLKASSNDASSVGSGYSSNPMNLSTSIGVVEPLNEKHSRLVTWITEVMTKLLQHVVARRAAVSSNRRLNMMASRSISAMKIEQSRKTIEGSGHVLEEVEEIIMLPKFDDRTSEMDLNGVELKPAVVSELKEYIYVIASTYSNNPFHNWEHASHVTMSVVKLLRRIVAPEIEEMDGANVASAVHDHTYGITSDPLTQFSVVLSALIHDIYHPGVPNTQLVKEGGEDAKLYKNKSVAEQKSVDLAWKLLMDPQFSNLRSAIYVDADEYRRFRQLVVNSVMATDIVDKELGAVRKARWDEAFSSEQAAIDEDPFITINRKATIVIEHIIQASDVAHTMQHWHIYRKFNQRLFEEMYVAYREGRAEKNPADFWFKGELGFFDHYIIPLTQKLKDCGVFGVSSDEYLNYALQNRKEWTRKGEKVVAEMHDALNEKYDGIDVLKKSDDSD